MSNTIAFTVDKETKPRVLSIQPAKLDYIVQPDFSSDGDFIIIPEEDAVTIPMPRTSFVVLGQRTMSGLAEDLLRAWSAVHPLAWEAGYVPKLFVTKDYLLRQCIIGGDSPCQDPNVRRQTIPEGPNVPSAGAPVYIIESRRHTFDRVARQSGLQQNLDAIVGLCNGQTTFSWGTEPIYQCVVKYANAQKERGKSLLRSAINDIRTVTDVDLSDSQDLDAALDSHWDELLNAQANSEAVGFLKSITKTGLEFITCNRNGTDMTGSSDLGRHYEALGKMPYLSNRLALRQAIEAMARGYFRTDRERAMKLCNKNPVRYDKTLVRARAFFRALDLYDSAFDTKSGTQAN